MAKSHTVDVHVGARMRQRRSLLGMSQTKVGDAVGLTFQQIQKYERGSNRIGSSRLFEFAKVLDVPLTLAAPACRLVALIKPQFEVGRGEVGKGGVVRDAALHARVCEEVRAWLEGRDADLGGWHIDGIEPSPITGPEGNVEFLISARRGPA